ncbi:hypothetical protein KKF32_04935 [Patescibacteria group bacterium]|nr:hypothetical protein [Patescibacteria group bacterium]
MIEPTKRFISLLKKSNLKDYYAGDDLSRIQVDAFISKIAFIYEKVRNTIEYKEEHLLRKSAIERIVWRRINIGISKENIATSLIKELIRAGYLENNLIPTAKVEEVNAIINKYLVLMNMCGAKKTNSEGNKLLRWLISLAACEIEESLVPPIQHFALVHFAYQVMGREVNLVDNALSAEEKKLQVVIAINRVLIKSDPAMVHFLIWKYYNPKWRQVDKMQLQQIAQKVKNLKLAIERQAKYHLSEKLIRLFKKYAIIFQVLREIILENPEEAEKIFSDPQELESHIKKTCEKLYKKARTKLRRGIFRVTLYIFITKMLLILLLELPYERYIAESVIYLPLIINALFPPALMFLIGMIIRVPSKKNTQTIIKVAKTLVYQGRAGEFTGIGAPLKRSQLKSFVFGLLYFILFAASFGLIIYILLKLSFTVFSVFIFLLFLSVVSFFGITIRQGVRELVTMQRKENFFGFLLNLLSLPFLRMGHWISVKFSKINIFVFIFDFIIEAPFKIFLEVVEDWFAFLREKKEELYH